VRMLHNLIGLSRNAGDTDGMLRYLNAILAVSPADAEARVIRAVVLGRTGRRAEAIVDADWLLQNRPEGINLNEVDRLRRDLDRGD
jgi:hypothetical protein